MPLKRAGLFMYPWDFIDEGVDDLVHRVRDLGVTRILLTSVYHAGFFLHPHNPRRKTHLLEDGVAYFHPTEAHYDRSPIKPAVASLCASTDWFGRICAKVVDAGLAASAWTVCLHNTRLGLLHPQATVRNVYGDSYPHAMSPAHPDARAYVRALVSDLAEHYPLLSVLLEAPDYRKRAHGSSWVSGHHHERDGVYLRPLEQHLMDLSFNEADVQQASQAGIDVEALRTAVRSHMDRYFVEAPQFPPGAAETVDQFRESVPELATYEAHLRRMEEAFLVEMQRATTPHGVKLEGPPSPAVDMVLAGGYGEPPERISRLVEDHRSRLRPGQDLGFGLRLGFNHPGMGSPLLSEQDTKAATRAVVEAGADEVVFYNYGEAPARSVEWIRSALRDVGF